MVHPKRIRHPLTAMGRFMCSIVGTCLTLKETEKMARRFGYNGDYSPYEFHAWMVEACQKAPEVAKYLTKYLSGKYRLAMSQVDKCEGEDLGRVWKEAVGEGRVAGAYWAILTRRDAPEAVIVQVFSEVHMMSHLQGAEVRTELKELDCLRQDHQGLKERLNKLQAQLGKVSRERDRLRGCLAEKEGEISQVSQILKQMEKDLLSLTRGEDLERLQEENRVLLKQLAAEKSLRQKLEMRLLKDTVRQLPTLKRLPEKPDTGAPAVEVCPLGEGDKCPRFCDKCILFVGGLDRLEPHYRSLVEKEFGARFMRHDGDCHNGQARLINMVKRAEAVICPLNCNSHRACLCVKKICKELNKPCVLMRNSGLGSLNRVLTNLAEVTPGNGRLICD